ncbi:septal ring lytic transglycosylase RlpA family protein [Rivularia sp. UHCC 0363]|uniref:septal ring lytic transglycosylase RlpA family protein n=1 Tax=Rivularia sp. UHCC 0363 TaxID=3110244 RepID=UPI003A599C28
MNQQRILFALLGISLTASSFNYQQAQAAYSQQVESNPIERIENNQSILIAEKRKEDGCSSQKASYYGSNTELTAAHKTLPFGTKVKVTNKNNGRSVIVSINDRGPFISCRIIDVSRKAAKQLKMMSNGVVPVSIEVLGNN